MDDYSPEKVDPELLAAIDDYVADLRRRMINRVGPADEQYQGKWKFLTEPELKNYLNEEVEDEHVYRAMGRHRFGWGWDR